MGFLLQSAGLQRACAQFVKAKAQAIAVVVGVLLYQSKLLHRGEQAVHRGLAQTHRGGQVRDPQLWTILPEMKKNAQRLLQ